LKSIRRDQIEMKSKKQKPNSRKTFKSSYKGKDKTTYKKSGKSSEDSGPKPPPRPSAEAKALSLFLMAYKSKGDTFKEHARIINKRWELVKQEKLSWKDYAREVKSMLANYGGYEEVIEKTVRYYLEETGSWKSSGKDKYSFDAKRIADEIQNK